MSFSEPDVNFEPEYGIQQPHVRSCLLKEVICYLNYNRAIKWVGRFNEVIMDEPRACERTGLLIL